ncbi:MAG: nitroreductase family protein [Planctomycetes bacterium]|nr:nitroreductase family protein [Planctomycetota bacterium]
MSSILALACLLAGISPLEPAGPQPVALPRPGALDMSLGGALWARRSTRSFDEKRPVSREQLAALLWAMAGVNRPDPADVRGGHRTAPSAFGACAVEVWLTSAEGTFRYDAARHALVPHASRARDDLRSQLTGSDWARKAPVLIALVVRRELYPERVSAEEQIRYAHADAAAIGQNLYLACAVLGLGTVLTDSAPAEADEALGLTDAQDIVFVMPLGHPAPAASGS